MGAQHEPVWTKPEPKKTLIQKIAGPVLGLLLALFLIQFFLPKNQQKDDFQLMEELIVKKAWASIVHLSALLRLCQSGNDKACELLDEYPEHRNAYIPRIGDKISHQKINAKIADLYHPNFTKSEISTRLFEALTSRDKDVDLDAIFEAGLKKVRSWPGMVEELIKELEWFFLERGYDPTDWLVR